MTEQKIHAADVLGSAHAARAGGWTVRLLRGRFIPHYHGAATGAYGMHRVVLMWMPKSKQLTIKLFGLWLTARWGL